MTRSRRSPKAKSAQHTNPAGVYLERDPELAHAIADVARLKEAYNHLVEALKVADRRSVDE